VVCLRWEEREEERERRFGEGRWGQVEEASWAVEYCCGLDGCVVELRWLLYFSSTKEATCQPMTSPSR
jgi:hypothetical protein